MPPSISHPTGATDVILRMETGGGVVPLEFFSTQIPQFSLYGDGTVVFKPQPPMAASASSGRQPDPPFLTAKLTEQEIQELLDVALNAGHLAVAKESYSLAGVADGPTTLFTVNAGGYDKTVNVYALGISSPYGDEADDREHMALLANRLVNFQADSGHDASSTYEPAFYCVTLFRDTAASPLNRADWPWPDVSVSDFRPSDARPGNVMIMTRDQVSKLTAVPNGGQMGLWVRAPTGSPVELSVRPLLPDEIATDS